VTRRRLGVLGVELGAMVLLAGALGLGRAPAPTGYGEATRDATVAACTRAGGDAAACACAYDLLESTLPFEEFAQLDDDVPPGAELPGELVELLGPCSRLPS